MNTEKYLIATSGKLGNFNVLGKFNSVSEDLFWQTVKGKVKELVKEYPEQYNETLQKVKDHFDSGSKKTLTILDTCFDIKTKKS